MQLLEEACDCLLTLGLSAETQLKAHSSVPAANKVDCFHLFTRAA